MTEPTPHKRDWWVNMGMTVSAVSAGFSSFAGLKSLAEATGWAAMAPLFALCLDAYALTAIRVWLASSTTSARARSFAKFNAIGAIVLSLAGNAVWHLIAANLLTVNWVIVLVVGGIPPVILGLVSHLAVLRSQVDAITTTPPQVPQPIEVAPEASARAGVRTQYSTDDELYQAALAADTAWRAAHDGRPISRDELRKALSVSGTRASAVLRAIREGRKTGASSSAT